MLGGSGKVCYWFPILNAVGRGHGRVRVTGVNVRVSFSVSASELSVTLVLCRGRRADSVPLDGRVEVKYPLVRYPVAVDPERDMISDLDSLVTTKTMVPVQRSVEGLGGWERKTELRRKAEEEKWRIELINEYWEIDQVCSEDGEGNLDMRMYLDCPAGGVAEVGPLVQTTIVDVYYTFDI